MTLTLEREIEQLATVQAARRGVPVEKYVSDLVQRDASNGGTQSTSSSVAKGTALMALYERLAPTIAAGVRGPLEATALLDQARAGREDELLSALPGSERGAA
jgi:hypothetical protein